MLYGRDFNKNVTEIFDHLALENEGISTTYDYVPYGSLAAEGEFEQFNPFCFSNEYLDQELGLVYYNYRHYNPMDGRWISRDLIREEGGINLYEFIKNIPVKIIDYLGLTSKDKCNPEGSHKNAEVLYAELVNFGSNPGDPERLKTAAQLLVATLMFPKVGHMGSPKGSLTNPFVLPRHIGHAFDAMDSYLKTIGDIYVYIEITAECCKCVVYGIFKVKKRLEWTKRKISGKTRRISSFSSSNIVEEESRAVRDKLLKKICTGMYKK